MARGGLGYGARPRRSRRRRGPADAWGSCPPQLSPPPPRAAPSRRSGRPRRAVAARSSHAASFVAPATTPPLASRKSAAPAEPDAALGRGARKKKSKQRGAAVADPDLDCHRMLDERPGAEKARSSKARRQHDRRCCRCHRARPPPPPPPALLKRQDTAGDPRATAP
eukprot:349751-Chlamydomonas_euryale.AAC.4